MNSPVYDDRDARYLLGRLSAEDAEAFEREWLTNQDGFERLLATEEWLLDEYQSRAMPEAARRDFRARYSTTPTLRSRLRLAGALSRVAAAPERAVVGRRRPVWLTGWRVAATLAAAAVLAGVAVVVAPPEIPPPAPVTAPGTPLPGAAGPPSLPAAVQPGANGLERLQTIELAGNLTRSDQPAVRVAIDPGVSTVQFRLALTLPAREVVDVVLRGPDGRVVREWRALPVAADEAGPRVAAGMPSSALGTGLHEFAVLAPARPGASPAAIDFMYVIIERPR